MSDDPESLLDRIFERAAHARIAAAAEGWQHTGNPFIMQRDGETITLVYSTTHKLYAWSHTFE